MIAVGVDFGGLVDLPAAIARGRAAAMPKMAKWVADQVRANIAAQRDPWGRGWRPKSRNSDGGQGPALTSFASKVREESTDTSWNVVIDDEHASSHQFGRAKVKRGNTVRRDARRASTAARTADREAGREARRLARLDRAGGLRVGDAEGVAFLRDRAVTARATAATLGRRLGSHAGEPPRAMLPLRVRSSGRQEPLVDFPIEWARELDRILDAEIQREIDALRPGTSSTASAA